MRHFAVQLLVQALLWGNASAADYRITNDYGGVIDEYKTNMPKSAIVVNGLSLTGLVIPPAP
jgi:hypothetical protein